MSEFIFNSPKVLIKERDTPFSTPQALGTTSLGLVGETTKGPAFIPMLVASKAQYRRTFGFQSNERMGLELKFPLAYYANSFLEEGNQLYVTRVLGLTGYEAGPSWAITLTVAGVEQVVAVIRSRAYYSADVLTFHVNNLTSSVVTAANGFSKFTISSPDLGGTTYTASLNPASADYLPKVLGSDPKNSPTKLYVESIYPELIKQLVTNTVTPVTAISTLKSLVPTANYTEAYQTPETPYIVSELRGNSVQPLYKFSLISDGDSANHEIKISHENIDPYNKEFDVVIRDYNDTDDAPVQLERFNKCSLNESLPSFIGRRIGSRSATDFNPANTDLYDLDYPLNSKFVIVEMAPNFPQDAIPAGFEGYEAPVLKTSGATLAQPKMKFKTSYNATDKLARTYLGISERGYDSESGKGRGINPDFFAFKGKAGVAANTTKQKGFHMDSAATGTYSVPNHIVGQFEVGAGPFATATDVLVDPSHPYAEKRSRKFTVVPYGGFDGWDVFRDTRTNTDAYAPGGQLAKGYLATKSDYLAYLSAILKYSDPENVEVNLFATPGINWFNHSSLVNEALDMIETDRQDALYIVDAPEMGSNTTPEEIVDMFEAVDIDSSYATTYYPPLQQLDKDNNVYVYVQPTGEVCRIMALTDKLNYPWFAPAGTTRGLIQNATKTRVKLRQTHRDILQQARINPIADFNDVGVDVFGQRTTQRTDSLLTRISVRRMILHAKYIVKKIARNMLFEPNDDIVAQQFMAKVNPILREIQRERGLRDFRVELTEDNTPETLDRGQRFFRIALKPTSSLEEIGIFFDITPSGVVFKD